jgi:hypothetical protein
MGSVKISPAAMALIHNDCVTACGHWVISPDYPDHVCVRFFPEYKRVRYLDCIRVQCKDLFKILVRSGVTHRDPGDKRSYSIKNFPRQW